MAPAGSISLGQVAVHAPVLMVVCARCESAGQYRLKTLIRGYGPAFTIPELLRLLSEECLKRQSITFDDFCGVHCPQLPELFLNRLAS